MHLACSGEREELEAEGASPTEVATDTADRLTVVALERGQEWSMRGHPTNFGFDPTLVIAKLLNHPKCGELAFVQFGIHGGPGPSSWIAVDTLRRNLVELVGHEAPRDVVAEDPLRMGTCDAFATPMGDQLSNFIRKSLVESGEPR